MGKDDQKLDFVEVNVLFLEEGWCVFDGDAGIIHAKWHSVPWKQQSLHLYSPSNVLKVIVIDIVTLSTVVQAEHW